MSTLVLGEFQLKKVTDEFVDLRGYLIKRYDYYAVDDTNQENRLFYVVDHPVDQEYTLGILLDGYRILDQWGRIIPGYRLTYKKEGFKEYLTKCLIRNKIPDIYSLRFVKEPLRTPLTLILIHALEITANVDEDPKNVC